MKPFYRLIACLLLTFVLVESANATCIIVCRTPTAIYAGADGKHTLFSSSRSVATTRCKMVKCGHLYFAAAGVTENPAYSYDIYRLAAEAGDAVGSMGQTISRIESLMTQPLSAVLASARDHHKEQYSQFLKFGPLHFVLFGFENGVAVMSVRDYDAVVSAEGSITLRVNRDTSVDVASGDYATYLGSNKAIRQFRSARPRFWLSTSPLNGIRKLIQMEIESNSEYVGPPISILEVTKEGARLVENKLHCPL